MRHMRKNALSAGIVLVDLYGKALRFGDPLFVPGKLLLAGLDLLHSLDTQLLFHRVAEICFMMEDVACDELDMFQDQVFHEKLTEYKAIRRKSKKIAVAVYEYSADCDGDWGEISFDFVHGTAEVLTLAGVDSSRTNRYARAAIREILSWAGNDFPRNWIMAMEP